EEGRSDEGERGMGTDRGMSRKQVPANPGLPHRRYSVPETVMRKYTLTKQRSESGESGVATVPTITPRRTLAITAEVALVWAIDPSKNPRPKKSPVSSETELLTRSTLDTVSEEINDSIKGKASGDTLDRISSLREDLSPVQNSGNISYKSKTSSALEEVHKNLQGTPDSVEPIRHDYLSQTPAEESSIPQLNEQNPPGPSSSERGEVTSSQTINLASTESRPPSIPEKQEESTPSEPKSISLTEGPGVDDEIKSPSRIGLESADLHSSAKHELSSSEILDANLTENISQLVSEKEEDIVTTETIEPQTSGKSELSSSETLDVESTERKSQLSVSKEGQQNLGNASESTEPQSSKKDDLSSSQSHEVESSENNIVGRLIPPSTADSTENQSTIQDELLSTQTITTESVESRSHSVSNKDKKLSSRSNSRKDMSEKGRQRNKALKTRSSSFVISPLDTENTMEPKSSSRDELSSSQTMGIESTESRLSTNLNKESQERASSSPAAEMSFTPTECCVSTPDPERSQSMSSSSDRASESCSITPLGQTSESSASGTSPERPSVTLRSSPEQPSSDHTFSTQDATLSIKSESVILGRPVSVLARRSDSSKHPQVSDSEHSIGHIQFMDENVDNESHPLLNIIGTTSFDSNQLEKSQSTDSNSQQTGDSGHATEPDCKLGEEFCSTSKLNDCSSKANNPLSEPIPFLQAATNTESIKCRHHSRAWEIIIQPTTLNNSTDCPRNGSCGLEMESKGNKLAILPSKQQDGTRTYLLIRPNGPVGQIGSSRSQPMPANHDIQNTQASYQPNKI
ncbi:hypothetical protein L9F63_013577, partial [Diploptera punctata]